MKILNFGSLNIDNVYQVDHIVSAGETEAAGDIHVYPGGKGLNQSAALARAGAPVWHAGLIGQDGLFLKELCENAGVHTDYLSISETLPTGHTVIQVDKNGQNCILLFGGSNRAITSEQIDDVLKGFEEGDYLLLQNEINNIAEIIDKAYAKGMRIILNPSPFDDLIKEYDLTKVSLFLVNEIEAAQMIKASADSDPEALADALASAYPNSEFVMTLGSRGSVYIKGSTRVHQEIFPVKAVDTTAAGDTFTGFFLASRMNGADIQTALRTAAMASSIAVTRAGAFVSIPTADEVREALQQQ